MESTNGKNRLNKLFARPEREATLGESDSFALPEKATLEQVHLLFETYAGQVNRSTLSPASKAMYIDFANCFVRWMHGGVQPGIFGPKGRQAPPFRKLDPKSTEFALEGRSHNST
jgi:hypothetical protein